MYDMTKDYPDHAIAVVGMACKFAGADNVEEYWKLLHNGLSMCGDAPPERFTSTQHRRSQKKTIYTANYMSAVDAFDHKFFKKSSREAESMDPQQRVLLEVAYQAVESSGYFGMSENDKDVGCYIGACTSDYNDNISSHAPNAFSTLGNLRAFLSGRISHYFGWTGPSLTFDTACSSSAVAIDAACKAIQVGSCTSAIAGGVTLFTSPYFFQNISAASFLSPTGPSKFMDANADGYCRGEGVGLVMLKKLSQAIADQDHIRCVIMSTAVAQNHNAVPIMVPYAPSQVSLYRKVLASAGVSSDDISYLEAHGTGTRIGDLQEYEGIREVFGRSDRSTVLKIASTKGNIGHTEGASGVASLIKTALMFQKRTIPRQVNLNQLNSKMVLEPYGLMVPKSSLPWEGENLIACINNFGASGSVSAMVVKEPPKFTVLEGHRKSVGKVPIILSAQSATSLRTYASTLRDFIKEQSSNHPDISLADIAFSLSMIQNRSLKNVVTNVASSLSDLDNQLHEIVSGRDIQESQTATNSRPVVLVFGGQVKRFVGLNRAFIESVTLLRTHLDECNDLLLSLGMKSIYPTIFETEPIESVTSLHVAQFALQYSCAMAWIDSGLRVDCVVGQSFGQLVAMTVSGILSLKDGLRFVYGRAALMDRLETGKRGAMLAIEASSSAALEIMNDANKESQALEIACYNGPTSHVIAGAEDKIGMLNSIAKTRSIKSKVLDVTHGFHSKFMEPLLKELLTLAGTLTFNKPAIPMETCSETHSWTDITPELIANHTRGPVFFGQAIKRIANRLGACTWLEAGSQSPVTNMVSRALGSDVSGHMFYPVNLSQENAAEGLAELTVNLWKGGYKVQFWPFHRSQRTQYEPIDLPPYEFEKSKHWLHIADFLAEQNQPKSIEAPVEQPKAKLLSFVGFLDNERCNSEFQIEPRDEEWQQMVSGHAVRGNPLCPVSFYTELAARAVLILGEKDESRSLSHSNLTFKSVECAAPVGLSNELFVMLRFSQKPGSKNTWKFRFYTRPRQESKTSKARGEPMTYASGTVSIAGSAETGTEFSRTERLLSYKQISQSLAQPDGESMRGSLIYKVFNNIVRYKPFYKGVIQIASSEGKAAAKVSMPNVENLWAQDQLTSPLAVDSFLQASGLFLNSLGSNGEDDIHVCTALERIVRNSNFDDSLASNDWGVFVNSFPVADKVTDNDIYVFDTTTEKLVMMILGARFKKTSMVSLDKVLARVNPSVKQDKPPRREAIHQRKVSDNIKNTTVTIKSNTITNTTVLSPITSTAVISPITNKALLSPVLLQNSNTEAIAKNHSSVGDEVRQLFGKITNISENDFDRDVQLIDLGVDSLMMTEIATEISTNFALNIPQVDLADIATFSDLRDYVSRRTPQKVAEVQSTNVTLSQTLVSKTRQVEREEIIDTVVTKENLVTDSDSHHRLAELIANHLDCTVDFTRATNLVDIGFDSLLWMELANDVERSFGIKVDVSYLATVTTFGDLTDLVSGKGNAISESPTTITSTIDSMEPKSASAQRAFQEIQLDFDKHAKETGFSGFWKNVYPDQSQLGLSYVVETFKNLDCQLDRFKAGEKVPILSVKSDFERLRDALYEILRDNKLLEYTGEGYIRSEEPMNIPAPGDLLASALQKNPKYAEEFRLLQVCGSNMAQLLRGELDPLRLLFGIKENRYLVNHFYSSSPMCLTMFRLIREFLQKAFANRKSGQEKVRVLEIGAGSGATTQWAVEALTEAQIPFTYVFSDISPSLVAAARQKFAAYDSIEYAVVDIEKEPAHHFLKSFDFVLSTMCIHATTNLANSLENIRQMVRPGGFVSLMEVTRSYSWFDLTYGVLKGWWCFDDGRQHILGDEALWEKTMEDAGFNHVAMTEGSSAESKTIRIITAFTEDSVLQAKQSWFDKKKDAINVETVAYMAADDGTILRSDIYYPSFPIKTNSSKWPVALLIHGGGHVMLSRKDVRRRQIKLLLQQGILPVSVDYRLCPEVRLVEGPMSDVRDALAWVRTKLPHLNLKASSTLKIDGNQVAAIGWSSGGTLALSLGWTAKMKGIQSPEAILAFYCPTNYTDPFWRNPNYPSESELMAKNTKVDLLEGVYDHAITAYNVPTSRMAGGGWLCQTDPRSKIALHMNWRGQTVPVLCHSLPAKSAVPVEEREAYEKLPMPSPEQVTEINPYAQIKARNSSTPTCLVHGTKDDLIPWEQSQKTFEALRAAGVPAELSILQNQPHLFDLYSDEDGTVWKEITKAYGFIFQHLTRNSD